MKLEFDFFLFFFSCLFSFITDIWTIKCSCHSPMETSPSILEIIVSHIINFIRKEKNKNIVKYKQQVKINLEYKIRNKIFFGMIYNKSNNLNLHKIVV